MNQKFDKKRINIYSVFFICILFIENQINNRFRFSLCATAHNEYV